jgi:hypothetical protein
VEAVEAEVDGDHGKTAEYQAAEVNLVVIALAATMGLARDQYQQNQCLR